MIIHLDKQRRQQKLFFEEYAKEDVDCLITSRIYAEDTNEHFKVTYLTFTSTNQISKQVYLSLLDGYI